MILNKLDIQKEIIDLIKDNFNKDSIDPKEELLGNSIGMVPLDLAILFHTVEKKYNVRFKKEDIISRLFNTVENISILIYKNR